MAWLSAGFGAPNGGGGPGHFSRMPMGTDESSDLPSPWVPGPLAPHRLDQTPGTVKKPNPPPVTAKKSLGEIKKVQNAFVDYLIEAEILEDGAGGGQGADTSFSKAGSQAPGYEAAKGKITKFDGKLVFKGTIQIQTKYAPGSSASSLSCYGRGTTRQDIEAGNITLGFHESCHRADYEAYLKNNPLPGPPKMEIGMDSKDYDKGAKEFAQAVLSYWKAMKDDSEKKTDQVGFTMKKADASGSCYVHQVP